MQQSLLRAALMLLALLFLLNSHQDGGSSLELDIEAAYFKFDIPPYPETFVILLTDPEKIVIARAMLAGQQPMQHIMGRIVKQPAAYNLPWSYHLDPASITFFHSATELCDETIAFVESHLDEACGEFLPGCIWCTWGSRLIKEMPPPVEETQLLYRPLIAR